MMIGMIAGVGAIALIACNLAAMALANRCWRRRTIGPRECDRPPVSILRPLRGVETFSRETIAATFELDWPDYEILFCVQSPVDPVIPLVETALARHPHVDARLLVGNDAISANPKLNNCVKGWHAARHEWVVMADSNVFTPHDFLRRLMARVQPHTALVVSMPWGTRAHSFWAEVECVLLNTFQARWQFAAAALGRPFAQGKTMMWRRSVLNDAGGLAMLASEPAEDAAATQLMRRLGRTIALVDVPFEQPLGARTAREVWARHTRWARLRRATFPLYFAPECLTGALPPVGLAAAAAWLTGADASAVALLVALILYGAELALAAAAGMTIVRSTLPAMIVRDILLPALYVDAWLVDGFVWHGHSMSAAQVERSATRLGLH